MNMYVPSAFPSYLADDENRCSHCHQAKVEGWRETHHAHAWDALVAAGSENNPYCVQCHTTGYDNVVNFDGSIATPGVDNGGYDDYANPTLRNVTCEACHGPGSKHVPNPPARNAFVDTSAKFCGECHSQPFDSDGSVIEAADGFIKPYAQYPELLASGAHAALSCLTCHDPHKSVTYDRENALRKTCQDCHPTQDMARHQGLTFVRGDYVEQLSCESCHMSFAARSGSQGAVDTVGSVARVGDTRTHIFRINPSNTDFTAMFNEDMTEVARDANGRAAVTLDFVCLRCHNGVGNAFELTVTSASAVTATMHPDGP